MSTNSTPPPSLRPPVESGSGKYIALILLFGGASAGLFFWHQSQTSAPAPAPTPSASAAIAAAHAPHDEPVDIPPPPPPAVPDAAPESGTAKATSNASSAPAVDSCAQPTCIGQITPDLNSALSFRGKTAHKCYDEALGQDPTLKGQVVINVRVGTNGAVCSSSVVSSEISNPSVAACIANKFRQGARLPSPAGGCVDVDVPMKLLPPH
jgi:hypothetical protein